MNKSLLTNSLSFLLIIIGFYLDNSLMLTIGLFAFSGAITNWLAIHMLFEKIPGLYGSGVIPARFEEFKLAIKSMMLEQFFNQENLNRFMQDAGNKDLKLIIRPVIEKIDLAPSFDQLVVVIMESSFGSMLGMFGGQEALLPLKEPFINKMKNSLTEIVDSDKFNDLLQQQMKQPEISSDIRDKVTSIIDNRLNELTPNMVKVIVQTMIKKHLGWLVVWGGIFGGILGALSTTIIS